MFWGGGRGERAPGNSFVAARSVLTGVGREKENAGGAMLPASVLRRRQGMRKRKRVFFCLYKSAFPEGQISPTNKKLQALKIVPQENVRALGKKKRGTQLPAYLERKSRDFSAGKKKAALAKGKPGGKICSKI